LFQNEQFFTIMERFFRSLLGNSSPFQDQYRIGFWSLMFMEKTVERDYTEQTMNRSIWIIRLMGIMGLFSFLAFGVLDYILFPESRVAVLMIRFLVCFPICLGILCITYSRYFKLYAQVFLSLAMATSALGVVGMILVSQTHEPGNALYYAGLIQVMLFSHVLRVKAVYAGAICLVSALMYNIVAIYIKPVDQNILLNNNFFIALAAVAGTFANLFQEIYLRVDYVRRKHLEAEKRYSFELYQQAQAASKAKSDFLAIVSHELRTPLNAVIGFSEIMSGEMLGPIGSPQYKEYAHDICNSGRHLLEIINDIIDFTKLESGTMTLNSTIVDLVKVSEICLKMVTQKAAEHNLRLAFDMPGEQLLISVDERLVRQVILNLLTNAIKFSYPGGCVTLSVRRDATRTTFIMVEDEGIGIAPENIGKIFQPFVQVEDAMIRNYDGMGLGLPLVKQITELHGGEVSVASTQGKGTAVQLALPPCLAVSPATDGLMDGHLVSDEEDNLARLVHKRFGYKA
jgi:two-component system, cell cycle sensor histidine kinase PleC